MLITSTSSAATPNPSSNNNNNNNDNDQVDVFEVDAVIVGSGCGGGIMAEQLVTAGFTVLVLEKGGYFQPHEFARWRECEAMANLYERGGLATSHDGSVMVLAGSCLGGGSTLNWTASFRTPEHVLEDWASEGLEEFGAQKKNGKDGKGGEFQQSLDYVLKRMNVNCDYSHYQEEDEENQAKKFVVNENNRLLWKGSESCQLKPEKIPRNVKKCVDCGHCCFGCSHQSKQTPMNVIYEPIMTAQYKNEAHPALEKGGKLFVIPDCKVNKVLTESMDSDKEKPDNMKRNKIATGVEATVKIFEKELNEKCVNRVLLSTRFVSTFFSFFDDCFHVSFFLRKIIVNSKITISSAGALYTPALLLSSGFTHPLIGKNLCLHPVLGCAGNFSKDVKTQIASGVGMGVVVKAPKDITTPNAQNPVSLQYLNEKDISNARTHGIAVETPPVHLGIYGLLTPWNSGLEYKIMSLGYQNTSAFIGISRDHCSEKNQIKIDSEGNPVIHYQLSKEDEKMLLIGLERQLRIMFRTGARYLFLGHSRFPWFYCQQPNAEEKLNEFIHSIWKEGIQLNKMNIFTAHQMSSCRMSATAEEGPTSVTGELYECENMFLADGSVLPTSLGINPMMTIEAMSHLISKSVIDRLLVLTGKEGSEKGGGGGKWNGYGRHSSFML
jgi:long-chain-alcohol oxidase